MKLTIIGSGTGVIKKERKGPSFLLTVKNKKLLFDCGWGCPAGLLETDINPNKLDHIFITHSHADHLTSLMPLLQSMLIMSGYYPKKAKRGDLHIHGYPGFKKDYFQLRKMMIPEKITGFKVKVYEYANDKRKFNDFVVQSTRVKHVTYFPSVAFKITHQGKSFVYGGDCAYDENLAKFASKANLLLADCSIHPQAFEKHGPYPTHLSPLEIGLIAKKADVKKVVLFHLYDLATDKQLIAAVKENFSGQVIVPQDSDQIII
jgi:ribonuclease BN (tRNA processing enzyme)